MNPLILQPICHQSLPSSFFPILLRVFPQTHIFILPFPSSKLRQERQQCLPNKIHRRIQQIIQLKLNLKLLMYLLIQFSRWPEFLLFNLFYLFNLNSHRLQKTDWNSKQLIAFYIVKGLNVGWKGEEIF